MASITIPTIENTSPVVGNVLSCNAGTWSPGAVLDYTWVIGGVLSDRHGTQYTVQDVDVGRSIQVAEHDSTSGATVFSDPTRPVRPSNLTLIETLSLSGWSQANPLSFVQNRCVKGRRYYIEFQDLKFATLPQDGTAFFMTYTQDFSHAQLYFNYLPNQFGYTLNSHAFFPDSTAYKRADGFVPPLNTAFKLGFEWGMGHGASVVNGTGIYFLPYNGAATIRFLQWRNDFPQDDPTDMRCFFLGRNDITATSVTLWERTHIKNVVLLGNSRTGSFDYWQAIVEQSEAYNGNRSTLYYNMGVAAYGIADVQNDCLTAHDIATSHFYPAADQNIMVIDIAINDIKGNTSGASCLTQLQALVNNILARNAWKIYLVKIAGCSNAGVIGNGATVQSVATEVATYNAGLSNISGITGVIDPTVNPHFMDTTDTTYYGDGLHPTVLGYQTFAPYVVAAIG